MCIILLDVSLTKKRQSGLIAGIGTMNMKTYLDPMGDTSLLKSITPNMLAFIEQNQIKKVIFGERRTTDNKPVLNKYDLENSDRIIYKFDDGSEMTLTSQDTKSATGFIPDWSF